MTNKTMLALTYYGTLIESRSHILASSALSDVQGHLSH